MAATNHRVEIIWDGTTTPVFVYPHDTVTWWALADSGENVGSGVSKATVEFTGSDPFTTSVGTITIEGGGQSDTYTVSTTAANGNHAYTLVCYSEGEHKDYTCEINVMSDGEIVISDGD